MTIFRASRASLRNSALYSACSGPSPGVFGSRCRVLPNAAWINSRTSHCGAIVRVSASPLRYFILMSWAACYVWDSNPHYRRMASLVRMITSTYHRIEIISDVLVDYIQRGRLRLTLRLRMLLVHSPHRMGQGTGPPWRRLG